MERPIIPPDEALDALAGMRQSLGWAIWERRVQALRQKTLEEGIESQTLEALAEARGRRLGMQEAVDLLWHLIQEAKKD